MGIQNLRLMFECTVCYHLGILPTCEACTPLLPYEVVEDAEPAEASFPDEFNLDPKDDPLLESDGEPELPLDDDDGLDFIHGDD
jgi:hypothetical protein